MGSGVKDLEKLTVHFDCDGPIGDIVAQADAHGNVRGYVANPQADATAMNQNGKLDVRAVVGGGQLYVTRDAGFEIGLMKEPYRGTVPIVSGEIGEGRCALVGLKAGLRVDKVVTSRRRHSSPVCGAITSTWGQA